VDGSTWSAAQRGCGASPGPSRWSQGEQALEPHRRPKIAAVAGPLDLLDEGPVDEPAGDRPGLGDRSCQAGHQRADLDDRAWVVVHLRELAGGEEAGELLVPLEQQPPCKCRSLGRAARRALADHQHGAGAAEAFEPLDRLGAHDCEVVTEDGSLDSVALEELELSSPVELDSPLEVELVDVLLWPELELSPPELEPDLVLAVALVLVLDRRAAAATSAGS